MKTLIKSLIFLVGFIAVAQNPTPFPNGIRTDASKSIIQNVETLEELSDSTTLMVVGENGEWQKVTVEEAKEYILAGVPVYTSDDIVNESTVSGNNVTEALNTLKNSDLDDFTNESINPFTRESDLEYYVSYTPQTPTKEQQDQALTNIGIDRVSLYDQRFVFDLATNPEQEFELDFLPAQIESIFDTNTPIWMDNSDFEITGNIIKINYELIDRAIITVNFYH